jgi:hypothetical protein
LFSATIERFAAISDWSVALAPFANTGCRQTRRGAATVRARR